MINDKLKKAREYEVQKEIAPDKRPAFHLTPRVGWMNDPNGFSYHNGEYHLFYQYHPYDTNWGPMHWGHAVSKDLLKWEYCPTALAPDESYDNFGCFSGSADTLDDGRQILMYTGVQNTKDEDGKEIEFQTQCIAVGDGTNFEKYEKNPVITADALPEGASKIDFRDPKIWKEKDGTFRCVVGSRPADGSGQILLYSSKDGFSWNFEQILIQNKNRFGKMWECPDFFELDGKRVLMFSPQGMAADGFARRNLFQSGYLLGDWQPGQPFVREEAFVELDSGHDFYAPQSFLTPDGRRIVIGWLDMWESPLPEQQDGWAGMLSLPRELSLGANNRLLMRPAKEVEGLRRDWFPWPVSSLKNQQLTMVEHCETMEVNLHWDMANSGAEQYGLSFGEGLKVYVDNQMQRLVLERRYPQYGLCGTRSVPLPAGSALKLRLFFDSSSVEVFVNDGEACLSSRIYPDARRRELALFSWSGSAALIDGGAWNL